MKSKFLMLAPVVALSLSGCASVMSGTDQDMTVDSNPKGAECTLTRENRVLATVTTPETIRVSKLKHDIYVSCQMDGFHESTAHVNSGTEGSTFGNIILGGGIGWAIDSARGADNKYAEVVTVTMVPLNQAAPEPVVYGVEQKDEGAGEAEAGQTDGDVEATEEQVQPVEETTAVEPIETGATD
ncbi:hypothetical protein [Emcibacter nanhaiensis]|uniref:Uncharacterized protein n=1 Tax=Emcibacter nanhaiensis TaxID=1505037 RepID=A0A501PQF6_9PROT|nr:hypothetical protein [Emcibacter nanhaiensis]TPD62759.1 hypothetical protein FIV46_01385 [Emcibacter nanhaiensis]